MCRCKAVVPHSGQPPGGNACYVGCQCDTANSENKCETCNLLTQMWDQEMPSSLFTAAQNSMFQEMRTSAEQLQETNGLSNLKAVAFENNNANNFCPDGVITTKGFYISQGKVGQGFAGWCKSWQGAAALSAEPTWCNMISSTTKVCSKMLITHPQKTPASVGTLVAKRMYCKGATCSVTKVGLCIDVKTPIFVPETCAKADHPDQESSACAVCNAESTNCDVDNQVLSDNNGATTSTVPNLGITDKKLDAKSMRMEFAEAAMAVLQELNGAEPPAEWAYACTGKAAERAEALMKLQ